VADLKGRTILISGASRGIGAATARLLAKDGVSVILAARTTGDPITIAIVKAASMGHEKANVRCDIGQPPVVPAHRQRWGHRMDPPAKRDFGESPP